MSVENRKEFIIYKAGDVTLAGDIRGGCLHLESCIYGDDYDSEMEYSFSKEDTEKLFSLLAFDDFIKACREGHLMWLSAFLDENDIHPKKFCF